MKLPHLVIDKDSHGSVIIPWVVAILVFAILQLSGCAPAVKWSITAVLAFICIFITAFFRVPERDSAGSESVVSSVADGEIVIVEKAFEEEFLKRECLRICIYMDFFDVHANFWPITGEVV